MANVMPILSGTPTPKLWQHVSAEEYLRREEVALEKSEYRDGEILPMRGASFPHTISTNNVGTELNIALKTNRECTVHSSDLKIHTAVTGSSFRYPDIAVVRGEPVRYRGRTDTIQNPVALVEVLSGSTEATDRGDKLEEYQTLPSLTEYILVAQDRARIEVYSRDGNKWQYRSYAGLDAAAQLPTLGISLALRDVYDKVTFPELADGNTDKAEPQE